MKIQILGTGCAKCIKLTENAEKAAKEVGVDFEIEKEDMYRIDSMQPAGWSGEHPDFPRVK